MSQSYHLSLQEAFVPEAIESGQETIVLNFPSAKILAYVKEVLTESQHWTSNGENRFQRVDGSLEINLNVDMDDRVMRVSHTVKGSFSASVQSRYQEILNEAFDQACMRAIIQAAKLRGEVKVTTPQYNKAVQMNQVKVEVFAY
jgi:hypothetical protein